jgi:hypothetical protein
MSEIIVIIIHPENVIAVFSVAENGFMISFKSSSEDKNTERKRKNSDVESEECNSCSQNQREDDHYEHSQSRFHLGAFDCFTNETDMIVIFIRKPQECPKSL